MSTCPDDLSHRFGIRLAFPPHSGDHAKALIFDKVTGEEIQYAKGRNWVESFANARFTIRGEDRRKSPRATRDRRQIVANPSHPMRRKSDQAVF